MTGRPGTSSCPCRHTDDPCPTCLDLLDPPEWLSDRDEAVADAGVRWNYWEPM